MKSEELLDLSATLLGEAFLRKRPWEVLGGLGSAIIDLGGQLTQGYEEVYPMIWVGEGTTIDPGATISPPCIIGKGCEIRTGAYIRGNVLIGDGCVIGNSTEVKNAILFDGVKAPHFNYIGDSILGKGVHLGAGVILSNVRCDHGLVIAGGKDGIPTGRRKMGAVLGDFCEVGCHCVLNPGTILGRGCMVYPLTSVKGFYSERSRIGGKNG